MATGNVTTTTAANWLPTIWSNEVLRATEDNLVMANLVKRYDADVAANGNSLKIPNLANLSTGTKSADTAVTYSVNTEDVNTISLNQHKYAAIRIEDISQLQSKPNVIKEYTAKIGFAVAEDIDTALCNLATGFSQSVGDGSTNITDANMISAIRYLDTANAPLTDRAFVIDAYGIADLRGIDKFTRYDALGTGKAITDAKIGQFYGIPVYVSNNIKNTAGTPGTQEGMLFHKEALALALQMKPSTKTAYDIDYLAQSIVCETVYGVAELRDAFGVNFKYTKA